MPREYENGISGQFSVKISLTLTMSELEKLLPAFKLILVSYVPISLFFLN